MGDFLYGFVLGKVVFGLFRLYFKFLWFLARVAWWLGVFLILSAGAGVAFLMRGGRRPAEDSGKSGQYLPDGTGWRDDESGIVYPVSGTELERCEIHATEAGTYWRRTAVSRLLRGGALLRYRFAALTDPAPGGRPGVAAWYDFPFEARHNITLDHLDPVLAGADQYGLGTSREQATDALKHVQWLLTSRGWKPDGYSADPSNTHWYAARYARPAISWHASLPAAVPAEQGSQP